MDVEGLIPLTPASFHILLVLAAGPAHGYAIMRAVDRFTGAVVHLGPGTLYRTIQRLLDAELIEPAGTDTDQRRVPYRLTRLGMEVARAEATRLATLVRIARRVGVLDSMPRLAPGAVPWA